MNIRVGFGYIIILMILTSCHKTYDCTCTDSNGQSRKIGTVSASKKKAKELCANNANGSTSISCTINE